MKSSEDKQNMGWIRANNTTKNMQILSVGGLSFMREKINNRQ